MGTIGPRRSAPTGRRVAPPLGTTLLLRDLDASGIRPDALMRRDRALCAANFGPKTYQKMLPLSALWEYPAPARGRSDSVLVHLSSETVGREHPDKSCLRWEETT